MRNKLQTLFGTDGIRGVANTENMTPEVAMKVGMAIGTLFRHQNPGQRHVAVIGKDTRRSGYLLEPAITSGFISCGMDVLLVGPMPTPAISMLTKSLRADVGVMISASHNTFEYNGMKFFGADGFKFSADLEAQIEALVFNYPHNLQPVSHNLLGRATRLDDAPGRYIEFTKNTFPKSLSLSGLKIVIDSANGAAYHLSEKIFWELGAEVIHLSASPDGFNINKDCGSTNPALVQQQVLLHNADIGIALDGDSDRVILVDNKGNFIDGDKILAIIALDMAKSGCLVQNTVVATHMSNLGFEEFLQQNKIKLIRTDIGDKHVANMMRSSGFNLGGEQSGHIILSELSATGDGIVAALQVLKCLIEGGHSSVHQMCKLYEPFPQEIINIKLDKGADIPKLALDMLTQNLTSAMKGEGRVLIRKSGTEPLIRVMVEAKKRSIIDANISVVKSKLMELA